MLSKFFFLKKKEYEQNFEFLYKSHIIYREKPCVFVRDRQKI